MRFDPCDDADQMDECRSCAPPPSLFPSRGEETHPSPTQREETPWRGVGGGAVPGCGTARRGLPSLLEREGLEGEAIRPRVEGGRTTPDIQVQVHRWNETNTTATWTMVDTSSMPCARRKQRLISAFFPSVVEEEDVEERRSADPAAQASDSPSGCTKERETNERRVRTTEMPPIVCTYQKRQKNVEKVHERERKTFESPDSVLPKPKTEPNEQEHECKQVKPVNISKPKKQLYLDLGQVDFSYTTCKVCGIMYAKGEEQDEHTHDLYHKQFLQGIRFTGWKEERLLGKTAEGRILAVLPGDHPHHLAKVKEVSEYLEKQLGLCPGWLLSVQVKAFLFVKEKKVLGSVIAEDIKTCHQVRLAIADGIQGERPPLQSIALNETNKGAICGFRVIWVHQSQRRMRVATRLLDAARSHWMPGCVIPHHLCAFSQVTEDGKALAQSYCRTSEFLVYK